MRSIPVSLRPDHGPAWWRNPVARVLVLSLAGTAAALTAVLVTASLAGQSTLEHRDVVEADLARIHHDLETYRAFTGEWPPNLAAVYGGARPVDPWGRPYVLVPPAGERRAPDVATFGADGWPGGTGARADRWMTELHGALVSVPGWGVGSS